MTMVFDALTGRDVDTASEEWRHACECRWLLANKPTKSEKHMHLYGVPDRAMLFEWNHKAGRHELAEDHARRWQSKMPLMKMRGIEAADRILADARRLYEAQK